MATMAPPPDNRRMVAVDVDQFVRTRDALSTAFMTLSSSIDKAVKAYIEHTNAVLAGDASLNVSHLTQPFHAIAAPHIAAHFPLHPQQNGGPAYQQPPPAAVNQTPYTATVEEPVNGKRKKRAYKQRDPNAPKRPLTAYFRFLAEMRPILVAEMAKNPNTAHKPGELSKEATDRWNSMDQELREPYHEAYREALKVYNTELEAYKGRAGSLPHEDTEKAVPEEASDKEALVGAKPTVTADDSSTSSSDDDEDEEEAAPPLPPPPPPPKKSFSPETAKKTPKSAAKKAKATAPTPQFSSINPPTDVIVPPSSSKKRKANPATTDEVSKKKRGPAAAKVASSQTDAGADEAAESKKKKEKKKRKPSDA